MQNTSIYRKRIRQFIDRVNATVYGGRVPLALEYTYDKRNPIPHETLGSRKWRKISVGDSWGELWGSAWFKISGVVPVAFKGSEVVALVDVGSEACLFVDGSPRQGLTDGSRKYDQSDSKRQIDLVVKAKGGEKVDLLLEAGANALFGYHGRQEFVVDAAELAVFSRARWQLSLDFEYLYKLMESLPESGVRARRLLTRLNDAANAWRDGAGEPEVAAICAELLKVKAAPSATTAWSVGHAHLDLGWLWPVRETRRKAGRTFSTALRMLEEYPDYVFGASQPQALDWVKSDYPALYKEIKSAVKGGRWECQGAMWVEPDTNVPSGESLVRQLVFGKRFFQEEFGVDVNNLWLPDVFGYSAALPQILKLAGVDFFMTQKISWNETNTFPHHTFTWEGIDGTRILTHFLPTNNYNLGNLPGQLIAAEERFAQADVSDDFLNLYGIGDGGGGPGRSHIEFARRGANTEGMPRVRMAPSTEFFKKIAKLPAERLPLWSGELYLELHRGTLTTQAKTKQGNRRLEHALHDTEFLSALAALDQRAAVAEVWKETLLNQFHDILPGSSITWVYRVVAQQVAANLAKLEQLRDASLGALHGRAPRSPRAYAVHNSMSWIRHALAHIPWEAPDTPVFTDVSGQALVAQPVDDGYLVPITVPSMGYTGIGVEAAGDAAPGDRQLVGDRPRASQMPEEGRWSRERIIPVAVDKGSLENALLRVKLAPDGSIASIYDKEFQREVLAGPANRLLLWEDYPYSWDAWDISHYYRETEPEQAKLVSRSVVEAGPLRASIQQELTVGSSTIRQRVVLEAESRLVEVQTEVDWNESQKQLRVQASPAVRSPEATYEVQFGVVKRPAHGNTSWDAAQFEVCGHRFADYSQPDYGLGLVNDSKYGHYIRDGLMELTLLRSSSDPDPEADRGRQEFTFGYYPHALGFEASDLLPRSHELNAPLIVRPLAKRLEEPVSEFAVAGSGVKIDTVKQAEDGDGVILRMYEPLGVQSSLVLRTRRPVSSVDEVDLLERPIKGAGAKRPRAKASSATGFSSEIELSFAPFQIRTFRFRFER